jgi:ABC-type uncharacterized transport system permease subunit
MTETLQRVSTACFGLSYLLAFFFELARLRWPSIALRTTGLILGFAGLLAHSIFLAMRQPTPAAASGGTLAVAWVLALIYLYGTLHYRRQAWAVFVLPVVLALVGLSIFAVSTSALEFESSHIWGTVHGLFILLAAVGVCVGCIASIMYLIQARRLRLKQNPLGGMKMLSLERLETMNRRAVNVAFPLLTIGLLLGAILLRQYHEIAENWFSLKVLGTVGLWVVFAVLLYLRYATHVPGRRLAWFTLAAFALMLLVLAAVHPFATSEQRTLGHGTTEVSS